MERDTVEMFGRTWYRNVDTQPYYTVMIDGKYQRLHRAVWESHYGPIPKGLLVHHIDGDSLNNDIDNLELMTRAAHASYHHKDSEEHREHMRKIAPKCLVARAMEFDNREAVTKTCAYCGKKWKTKSRKPSTRFCSRKCFRKARDASGIDYEIRVCEHCGVEFQAYKYSKTRCCSCSCGARARRT